MTADVSRAPVAAPVWVDVCAYDDLIPERGAAALVHGRQVAVFRTHEGDLYALSHRDPFSGAYVLARGILGTRGGVPTVASPMYKQVFDLRTGRCLDDPTRVVPAFRIRRTPAGRVEVAVNGDGDGDAGAVEVAGP
ncbi:MAG TPA: nitrite reductase small subunit NirD [Streptosporangiaceae bacterium]|nr:nitrite reductase small subunit NirD [Streptosporangiaceae bacterium]